jgi:hypothetical protein
VRGFNIQQDAAEIKVRAERRMGEMLVPIKPGRPKDNCNSLLPLPKLAEIGIDRMQSSRWQKIVIQSVIPRSRAEGSRPGP